MSREWKAGDVARLTMADETVTAIVRYHEDDTVPMWVISGHSFFKSVAVDNDALVQDARPLAVIDPEDREQAGRLLAAYTAQVQRPYRGEDEPDDWRTDRMQAALRELASPTPPKPDEPQGLGARVTDRGGLEWAARTGLHPAPDGMGLIERRWGCLNGSAEDRTWDELLDTRAPLTIEDGAA